MIKNALSRPHDNNCHILSLQRSERENNRQCLWRVSKGKGLGGFDSFLLWYIHYLAVNTPLVLFCFSFLHYCDGKQVCLFSTWVVFFAGKGGLFTGSETRLGGCIEHIVFSPLCVSLFFFLHRRDRNSCLWSNVYACSCYGLAVPGGGESGQSEQKEQYDRLNK